MRFLLGVIVGIILAFLFIYWGGGKILKKTGEKAVEVGEKVEKYEKAFKEAFSD